MLDELVFGLEELFIPIGACDDVQTRKLHLFRYSSTNSIECRNESLCSAALPCVNTEHSHVMKELIVLSNTIRQTNIGTYFNILWNRGD